MEKIKNTIKYKIKYEDLLEDECKRRLIILFFNIILLSFLLFKKDINIDCSSILTVISILFSFFVGFIFAIYANKEINEYISNSNKNKNVLYDLLDDLREESIVFIISILIIYIISIFDNSNIYVFFLTYNILFYDLLIIIYNICIFFNLYTNQYSHRIKELNKNINK